MYVVSFLSVKKWLLRKKHQIELARKRGWKGYWVCLKGTTLLFYPCDSQESRAVETAPKHLIIVDGAIMQPIPEHPKRDFIFCLSTAFGDAYLFQVTFALFFFFFTYSELLIFSFQSGIVESTRVKIEENQWKIDRYLFCEEEKLNRLTTVEVFGVT